MPSWKGSTWSKVSPKWQFNSYFFFCFAAKQKEEITISYMHFIIGQEIPQYIKDYLRSLELNVTWARPTAYGIAVEIRRAQVRAGYFSPLSNTAQ